MMMSDGSLMENCDGAAQLPKCCIGCKQAIKEQQHVQALGGDWHSTCFICHDCGCPLSSWYILKNGNLYCREHYWKLVGESCNHCGLSITGPIMLAGQHRYHPECFTCISCRCIIGYGEPYCLVERSKLYCGSCHRQLLVRKESDNSCSIPPTKHSIQVIEIPAPCVRDLLNVRISAGRRPSIEVPTRRATNVPCLNVDSVEVTSCELQAGDRILEVNGDPVRELEQSLTEIGNLLRDKKPVSLTIERGPSVQSNAVNNNGQKTVVGSPLSPTTSASPSSDTATALRHSTISDSDVVGVMRNTTQRTTGVVKRRSTLPRGFSVTGNQNRPESFPHKHEKHTDINRSSSVKPLPSGQRVFRPSDLEYGETLGSGFFGLAKKVFDKKTGEVMVIKELLQFSKEAQESFLKEVWVLRGLSHPNVLRFIGILYKDQKLNIVTEFAAGGTLQARITKCVLSWSQKVGFAHDIACGMAYLHSKDIVHRDLNSGNCFLKEDDTVVVADFGLARSVAPKEAMSPPPSVDAVSHVGIQERRLMFRRMRCKTVVGNPFFMAPEMMHGRMYDEKVDVFSFGIILCEITGGVIADPEYIPRSNDFGLDVKAFTMKYGHGCPEPFLNLTVTCCNMDSTLRPTFDEVANSLAHLRIATEDSEHAVDNTHL